MMVRVEGKISPEKNSEEKEKNPLKLFIRSYSFMIQKCIKNTTIWHSAMGVETLAAEMGKKLDERRRKLLTRTLKSST